MSFRAGMLSTKSSGVRRLSVVVGIIAACWYVVVGEPMTNHEGPSHQWQYLLFNLIRIAVGGGACFFVAWASVRIIAWIAAGFVEDRKS